MSEEFLQDPPVLSNTYDTDRALRQQLRRTLPAEVLAEIEPGLRELGYRATRDLAELGRAAEAIPPRIVNFDPWGRRIDQVVLDPSWTRMLGIAAELGLVAVAYERPWGGLSRLHQLALIHLFGPSTSTVACPLAMTDGCARTLQVHGEQAPFKAAALQRLLSRDPATAWTAGQWMTEKEGGSDVGRTSTVARQQDGEWRLYGTKFFTSAVTANCVLTLGRPEGAGAGSKPLTMFYLEPFLADGQMDHIVVRRLKDKLGTRALPTAELELNGTLAHPLGEVGRGGVRKITTVLNMTRYWNAAMAVSGMRRGVALAWDYAHRREAFGHVIARQPLHVETLAQLQVEYEGSLAMVVRLAELTGKVECEEATEQERGAWRLLTPLAKLFTGKQAVGVASEALEAFGGNGYMEDTGLPQLLRDAQVLPIWEGTTNVLALDGLRAIAREAALPSFLADAQAHVERATDPRLSEPVAAVRAAIRRLAEWSAAAAAAEQDLLQAAARRYAFSLSRTYIGALLCAHAQWALEHEQDTRPVVTARRWCRRGLLELPELERQSLEDAFALLS